MKLTKEKAVEYFNQKAPKTLREEGVVTIEEYAKEDESIFFINGVYAIRYIIPQADNHLTRNQNFSPVLKGVKETKKDAQFIKSHLKEVGYVESIYVPIRLRG